MTKTPWVRFFASDWLAGTRGMSAAETGIYITLIASMYERGEPLPEDHNRLSRLCGATLQVFRRALETMVDDGKIIRVDGGLWNERVGKERDHSSEKSEVASQAANARWNGKNSKNKASDNADAMPTQCETDANQNQNQNKDSVPNGTAASAPTEPDFRDLLWRDGVASLKRQTGKLDSSARQMIGRWLRDARDDCRLVFTKINQAEIERIGDPIPWITRSIAPVGRSPPKSSFAAHQEAVRRNLAGYDDEPKFEYIDH